MWSPFWLTSQVTHRAQGHSKADMSAWRKEGTADTETTVLLLACRRISMTQIRIKQYFIYLESFTFTLTILVPHITTLESLLAFSGNVFI